MMPNAFDLGKVNKGGSNDEVEFSGRNSPKLSMAHSESTAINSVENFIFVY